MLAWKISELRFCMYVYNRKITDGFLYNNKAVDLGALHYSYQPRTEPKLSWMRESSGEKYEVTSNGVLTENYI